MSKNYELKTRNFLARKWVKCLLDLSCLCGVVCHESADDKNDSKYTFETATPFMAWAVWCYFMALGRLSGGWTYIIKPGHFLGSGYKSIY